MRMINLGCGAHSIDGWMNVDSRKTGDNVIVHDLHQGVPFEDNSIDVVYHSHVLEHFARSDATFFLRECYRVLKPGGVIRIVVPDLEELCREYLKNLSAVRESGTAANVLNYEWSVVELIDQMVRREKGGEMGRIWRKPFVENDAYIEARMGEEYRRARAALVGQKGEGPKGLWARLRQTLGRRAIGDAMRKVLLGDEFEPFTLGRFIAGGETHQWAYDRHSLWALLDETAFVDIQFTDHLNSRMPNWSAYRALDAIGGKPRKPNSLFVEALR